MSWAVAAAAVASAGTAAYQSKKAGEAADAQIAGAERGMAMTQAQFDQTREDLAPYRRSGREAQDILSRTLGLGGGGGDLSYFEKSPGYQFRLDEGNKALERSAAARGMSLSGAQLKDLTRFGQGMASQEFGNWFNRVSGMAGRGQNAAVQTGGFGAQAAGTGANLAQMGGQYAGQGIINSTNAVSNAIGSLVNLGGQAIENRTRQSGYAGPNRTPLENIYRGAALHTYG